MTSIEADYLVIGAGAMGMAFVDTLLTETDATVVLVDENHQPGGHWNFVYPFVRLHQPSAYYGVNSRALGNEDWIDQSGPNEGFFELATGHEVCAYYDQVMRHQLLPTGRLSYFPSSRYLGDNTFRTLDGTDHHVALRRRVVDATYLLTVVQSMRSAPFSVADGIDVIAPNDLPRRAAGHDHYTIVGGGKTGMDCCLWLLRSGVAPEKLRWIMPRDSWLMNRASVQPGQQFVKTFRESIATRMTAIAEAASIDDLFARLEADGNLFRLDPSVTPTMYHCAIVSRGELDTLRLIGDVVRLGHLQHAEHDRIVLRDGEIDVTGPSLYVDCTTQGLPRPPSVPVFDGAKITLQSVRGCQQVFSSAFIAHVEAAYPDDELRNDVCAPIMHPDAPLDWLRILLSDNTAQVRWLQDPELMDWLKNSRLNVLRDLFPDFGEKIRVRDRAYGALATALTKTNDQLRALIEQA
ncbi:NAD(P)/FAD-dependent oxidoreductase [Mycolicibacterium sp. 018/SC-01/001]|uniref:NAD(P)/FAD-dependent oxidoreductase n=1 Tax=Mycolicibacterium sp. 018/SC-01/001 TaxID=2592069 RepID=UPI00117C606F|nr:NAD(P)/FAD-dependent oxidoreductase [Mycolicibacterium sp. 018/SC-01/001]TRW79295.1 NAD(P)/FAD-dependent oxidoreductase [Mycolicibacterium sp. 018/SC-01/001]